MQCQAYSCDPSARGCGSPAQPGISSFVRRGRSPGFTNRNLISCIVAIRVSGSWAKPKSRYARRGSQEFPKPLGSAGMLACLLREKDETGDDEGADDRRRKGTAQGQPAIADRLIKEIAGRGAKRPRQDEGRPEQENPRDIGPVIGSGQRRQAGGEDERPALIT